MSAPGKRYECGCSTAAADDGRVRVRGNAGIPMSDFESLAAALSRHPDFRVLRRLGLSFAGGPPLGRPARRAAIVDVETTGMDREADQLIELGLVAFDYDGESGQVGPVAARYSGFEDPGRPIPAEVTRIHGITDAMVAGQQLDQDAIGKVLDGVDLVIAHNAGFDRPFVERRLPLFAGLPWGCSLRDVPWKDYGMTSAALEFLAYRAGYFYDAHRAEMDCLAVLAVLSGPLGESGTPALQALLARVRESSYSIAALRSHFDTKDLLKARGYRWNPDIKVWAREVAGAAREAEFSWLKAAVYGGREAEVEVETLSARERYSGREGKRERVRL